MSDTSIASRDARGVWLPGAALLSMVAAFFILKSVTPISLWRAVLVVGAFGVMTIPLGYQLARWVWPGQAPMHVRVGLVLALGYAAAPLLLILTSRFGRPGLLAPAAIAAVLAVVWRRGQERVSASSRSVGSSAEAGWMVALIAALSVAVVTPLMAPLQEATSTTFVNYAYGDSFFHINLVQGLMRSAPLRDWPNVAGMPPIFYQDYHHLLLAALARLGRVSATDIYFVYAPVVIVPVTVVLGYAVGRSVTGSRVGGYLVAALQYVVLIPNLYDRNWFLQEQWSYMLPNFYQIHFYNLRYAQHAASGWIVMLGLMLCWSEALRNVDQRVITRVSMASGFLLAVLFRFRPQYFLLMSVPTVAVVMWANRRYWLGVCFTGVVGAVVLGWALYPYETLQTNSGGLVFKYGVFAARVSRAGYFLPDAVSRVLAFLPSGVRPTVGLAAVLGLRILGLNLFLLSLFGLRKMLRTSRASRWQQPEPYLWMSVVFTFLMALTIEQSVVDANLGWNILQGSVAPMLVLGAAAIVRLVGVERLDQLFVLRRSIIVGVTVLCSLVAFRGAQALMHERSDRAYPLAAKDLDAYAWLQREADPEAILAADPRHQVNAFAESIESTTFLSGMTGRSVYAQYLSALTRPEGDRRIALLKDIFDATTADDACRLLRTTTANYWLEYADGRFSAPSLPCLARVYSGTINIYRTVTP